MTMADKIVAFQDGVIEQIGSPLELYRRPRILYVAGFIGSPKMTIIERSESETSSTSAIGVLPEHLAISTESGIWKDKVGMSEQLDSDTFFHVEVEGLTYPLTARADAIEIWIT